MSGGSGMESMLPMLMMQQASRIDPLYHGQGAVDDINQTIMDAVTANSSTGQQQVPAQPGQGATSAGSPQRQSLPSGETYDRTMLDALDYINSIAGYLEPQHYDYSVDSSGKKSRVKKTIPTADDSAFYDAHETDAAAFDQLKEWNKKRKSTATSSTSASGGSSLLSGGTDLEALFASLLGGGK